MTELTVKTKICSKCKRRRRASSFSKKSSSKDGLAYYCRDCQKAYHVAWSKSDKAVASRRARQKANRKKLKQVIEDLKSVPCADCDKSFPFYAMDFDHVSGKKEFEIGAARRDLSCLALKTLMQEIAKCEVVCAVCHRIRTWNRAQQCSLVQK